VRHCFSWPKLSAISGVTLDQRLFLRLVRGVVNGEEVIEFLRLLLRHIRGPVLVVWDNIGAHRSRRVQQWLATHPRIQAEPLPPYAPDLNADEGVWGYLKNHVLANYCPLTISDLETKIRHSARRMRQRPDVLASFMKQTGLPY
jgi:putative transposase